MSTLTFSTFSLYFCLHLGIIEFVIFFIAPQVRSQFLRY